MLSSHEYLRVNRRSACQGERMCDVGEADVDRQNGDVEVQQHCSIEARVGGVIHQVVQLQGAVLIHMQVPLQEKV